MKLALATLFAALSATAVMAQSSTSELSSMSGYTDEQQKCVNDPKCQTDPQSCLTCLGVSSEDVDAAVDCMQACPQPTSLTDVSAFMECAAKCTSDMLSKIGSNSTTSASGSSNSTSSEKGGASSGVTSGDGSASYVAASDSVAVVAALPMALAVALPIAILAAL
ncbi:hypothetical protein H4R34_004430 [Dimargaris verticillata]|uniref:Uncharacterized protein n=1 Tax=Dimargaris verticillata TaxID=2761393 RepID=A0A9W8AY99_9FUNG|nr:hypothetical protein H4R34_004430 [Dimargaris verticillata]